MTDISYSHEVVRVSLQSYVLAAPKTRNAEGLWS